MSAARALGGSNSSTQPGSHSCPEKLALGLVLCVGFAIRLFTTFGNIAVLHPDEIFQYLEQGHRLASGSAVVPWEFDYGIRSWLPASLAAGVMKASASVSSNPLTYIFALRLLAATFSLVPIYVAFRLVLPLAGLVWATTAGLLSAAWYHSLLSSTSLLTEVLAAYLLFLAVLVASDGDKQGRKSAVLGGLLALILCFRFQMAPAVLVITWWHCRSFLHERWLPVLLAGSATLFVFSGVFDWLTLGTPFQSIWLNFYLNAVKGVSGSFGRSEWFAYLVAIAPRGSIALLPLVWLAVIGAQRLPLLSLTSLAVLVSHSFLDHKEYRFIEFVLLSFPALIVLGTAGIAARLHELTGRDWAYWAALAVALYVPITSYFEWDQETQNNLPLNSGVLRSFVYAGEKRDLCALGIADYPWSVTGGYTYFGRPVPLYYSRGLASSPQPGFYNTAQSLAVEPSPISMRMHVVLNGRAIKQFPEDTLFRNTGAFNYLIVAKGRSQSGYQTVRCFENEQHSLWATACLLRRTGGCTEP
jgi:hypothetical protein